MTAACTKPVECHASPSRAHITPDSVSPRRLSRRGETPTSFPEKYGADVDEFGVGG